MNNKFKIDLSIYPREKILEAIDDYSDVAEISLQNDELTISGDNDAEIKEIFLEFGNYVIGLINE